MFFFITFHITVVQPAIWLKGNCEKKVKINYLCRCMNVWAANKIKIADTLIKRNHKLWMSRNETTQPISSGNGLRLKLSLLHGIFTWNQQFTAKWYACNEMKSNVGSHSQFAITSMERKNRGIIREKIDGFYLGVSRRFEVVIQ